VSEERREHGVFGFMSDSIDSLPPELRERAQKAVAEYAAQEPIAEILVRVFRLERGGSEVRFKTEPRGGMARREWYRAVSRIAAQEVSDAAEILGDP